MRVKYLIGSPSSPYLQEYSLLRSQNYVTMLIGRSHTYYQDWAVVVIWTVFLLRDQRMVGYSMDEGGLVLL